VFAILCFCGIPVIAIVALIRNRTTARQVEESWYKTQDLQGEIANLRVNLLE